MKKRFPLGGGGGREPAKEQNVNEWFSLVSKGNEEQQRGVG